MTQWLLSEAAAEDLERLVDFLLQAAPEHAEEAVRLITQALDILQEHPCIGRPVNHGLRELVISRGSTGYVALYDYVEALDVAIVHAIRHQREVGYT